MRRLFRDVGIQVENQSSLRAFTRSRLVRERALSRTWNVLAGSPTKSISHRCLPEHAGGMYRKALFLGAPQFVPKEAFVPVDVPRRALRSVYPTINQCVFSDRVCLACNCVRHTPPFRSRIQLGYATIFSLFRTFPTVWAIWFAVKP